MNLTEHNSLPMLRFELFSRFPEIIHAVTTRRGGCSDGPYESLNLGFHVGDNGDHVLANRHRVLNAFDHDAGALITARQVHQTTVKVVTDLRNKEDVDTATTVPEADGLVTTREGLLLMIKVADCFPVFLYDPEHRAIGLLHVGWRGAARGIIENGITAMALTFRSNPQHIVAGVGPGINKCCFEVGEEVLDGFGTSTWFTDSLTEQRGGNKYRFDLKQAIVLNLESCGVSEDAIAVAGQCTACCPDMLYSHRRDNGKTGRMAAVFGLKGTR